MYGTVIRIFLSLVLVVGVAFPAEALAKSARRLLTINDIAYTDEDFKNWWKHWNDKGALKFPDTTEPYVDFLLMVQQGQEMGLDTQPGYLHKLRVFLLVRAMSAMKYEEVDSKAAISEAEVKKYFAENYGTVSTLQALTFSSEEKALLAYERMLPYQGQVAGRLVFADLYAGEADEKADSYDEVSVTNADFQKNKVANWLPIVKKLKPAWVAKPFLHEANQKYILLRLVEINPSAEGLYAEKEKHIRDKLNKEKRNRLSVVLTEKLKKKYKVQVDKELLASIKLDVDYPPEFLERKVITMDGFAVAVTDLIYNAHKEKQLRTGIPDEEILALVADNFIGTAVIDKEALARGYEKKPPLLGTYEFYKQNRLRVEVEAGLQASVDISDQAVHEYYVANITSFSVPAKATFSLLKGSEEDLQKVWIGTLQGGELNELVAKYSLDVLTKTEQLDSLSPLLAEELKKLEKDAISAPFELDGGYVMLKVLEHLPGQVHPLDQVKGQIVDQLKKEKLATAKVEYINKLKSLSKIDINAGVWKDLTRELANAKKD